MTDQLGRGFWENFWHLNWVVCEMDQNLCCVLMMGDGVSVSLTSMFEQYQYPSVD